MLGRLGVDMEVVVGVEKYRGDIQDNTEGGAGGVSHGKRWSL